MPVINMVDGLPCLGHDLLHTLSTNGMNGLATLLVFTGDTDLALRVWIVKSTVMACIDSCDFSESSSSVPIHPIYPCHGTDSRGPNLPLRRSYNFLRHRLHQ